jgi:hypothetical protein
MTWLYESPAWAAASIKEFAMANREGGNRVAVRVVQVGSREAVAARRVVDKGVWPK